MPRKFMVVRTKHSSAGSYRNRDTSDDEIFLEKNDFKFCEPESQPRAGSPDSGYSCSPINLIIREQPTLDAQNNNINNKHEKDCQQQSPIRNSPLSVSTLTSYPSPFYCSSFDRLSVCSNSPTSSAHLEKERFDSPLNKSPSQNSPNKRRGNSETENKSKVARKPKAIRKINFDEDKSSPVSGCIIKDIAEGDEPVGKVVYGDIDSSFNYVEVTPEAKAELEKIENKIGDYICQLCKEFYVDAFQLAQHRCSRIVHVEYRCPECDKVFSCPANLASHRRWHKPRPLSNSKSSSNSSNPPKILPAVPSLNVEDANGNKTPVKSSVVQNANILALSVEDIRGSPSGDGGPFQCETCGKKFRRQAYLRKHVLNHVNDQKAFRQIYSESFVNNNVRSPEKLSPRENEDSTEIPCSLCNLTLVGKNALEKHMKCHTNELFACKYCSSTFYSSPGLTRHINKCHPSENRQVILLQLPNNVHRPN